MAGGNVDEGVSFGNWWEAVRATVQGREVYRALDESSVLVFTLATNKANDGDGGGELY